MSALGKDDAVGSFVPETKRLAETQPMRTSRKQMNRFLELSFMKSVGRLSYSLYLWQQLFLGGPGRHLSLPIALAGTVSCAVFSYFVIEQPCIRIGRRLIRRRHKASVATTPRGSRTGHVGVEEMLRHK